ncbi:MAG: hypothetical protein ACLPTZ_28045 [Beijerinckiaceae bacterium]
MSYFVKVIPPSKRARIHVGSCKHCREGKGQEHQDKGSGPTYWSDGFSTLAEAESFMRNLLGYTDTGFCAYCKPGNPSDA